MSTKPPAFALHKTPILWEQRWQRYLDDLYVKKSKSVKALLLESPPDSVIRQTFKSNHSVLCELQRCIFNFAAERCTEDDFDRKWRAAGPKAQEKCFFDAMKRIAEIGAMEFQRGFAPEITLRNFRANDGWGYLNLLRSLLPDRLVVNEYIRIPHPIVDAALGIIAPFDTGDSMPTERDPLVHKAVDMIRCTFMSMVVWYMLCSFYNVPGDFPLAPMMLKSACANCKKRPSHFPNITFKSCAKCKDTPRSVMYCSRECQVNHWKNGDPPHKVVCGTPKPKHRSEALLKQIAMLEEHPSVDYFLMPPAPLPLVGLVLAGDTRRAEVFRQLRKVAFEEGDKTTIGLMHEFLADEINRTPDLAQLGLDAQITEEYGFSMDEIRQELKVLDCLDRFWENKGQI